MKIAFWFCAMVTMAVATIVLGVTKSHVGFTTGLVSLFAVAFLFIISVVEALSEFGEAIKKTLPPKK